MDLSEKIKLILSGKNISPSIFADEIGIQRSSMSHILAGRNKPSLDIVQKIVKRFPDLGVNWVWEDEVLPVMSNDLNSHLSEPEVKQDVKIRSTYIAPESPVRNEDLRTGVHEKLGGKEQLLKKSRSVKKVMIFYSDGTFEEFKSAVNAE
jgi:transcriptional regulator with XRE-family HTH domain